MLFISLKMGHVGLQGNLVGGVTGCQVSNF